MRDNLYTILDKLKWKLAMLRIRGSSRALIKLKLLKPQVDQLKNKIKFLQNKLKNKLKETNEEIVKLNSVTRKIKHKKFNKKFSREYNKKIVLLMQYYLPKCEKRNKEILCAINKNIKNNFIDKVVLFVEFHPNNKSYILNILKENLIDSKKLILNLNSNKRITFLDAMGYVKKNSDSNTVYLLANVDCYFNSSVELLRYINFKNGKLITCITRKDISLNGTLKWSKEPPVFSDEYIFGKSNVNDKSSWVDIDYNSNDAWAFTGEINPFNCNYPLGTWNCEYYLTEDGIKNDIIFRNITLYVDCIHIHNTTFRSHKMIDNQFTKRKNKLFEIPRNRRTRILGTWRLRSKFNYIDKNSEIQKYSDYLVTDFNKIASDNIINDNKNKPTKKIAVLFLTTKSEWRRKKLKKTIKNYFNKLNTEFSIDLFLSFDCKDNDNIRNDLKVFEKNKNINKLSFLFNNIPHKINAFFEPWQKEPDGPTFDINLMPMGRTHGVNKQFYDTMLYIQNLNIYENCLLLETDTRPMNDSWFDVCMEFVDKNDYIVAGSVYKGRDETQKDMEYCKEHLNGVALYKCSNKTKKFILQSRNYLKELLKNDYSRNYKDKIYWAFMNYDVALYLLSVKNKANIKKYRRLYKNTEIFSNYSKPCDSNISDEEILKENPKTVILHQKSN